VLITADTRFTWGRASDVVDGRAMHVRGTFDAASGKLVASAVAVRRFDPGAGLVTLLGTVSEFASAGSETHFRVRGVPVTTDGATNFGCVIDDGKLVAVAGHIVGSSVLATRIECPALAVGTVVDAYAQVAQLDRSARTFKLGNVGPLLSLATLQWDEHTVFGNGLTADTLADGQYVAVRGVYLGGGRFLLMRLILDDTPPTSPTGGAVFRTIGIAHHITGSSLVVSGIPMAIVPGATVPLGSDVVNGSVVRAWFYRDVPNARWVALLVRPGM
jgi:hypothetical protein